MTYSNVGRTPDPRLPGGSRSGPEAAPRGPFRAPPGSPRGHPLRLEAASDRGPKSKGKHRSVFGLSKARVSSAPALADLAGGVGSRLPSRRRPSRSPPRPSACGSAGDPNSAACGALLAALQGFRRRDWPRALPAAAPMGVQRMAGGALEPAGRSELRAPLTASCRARTGGAEAPGRPSGARLAEPVARVPEGSSGQVDGPSRAFGPVLRTGLASAPTRASGCFKGRLRRIFDGPWRDPRRGRSGLGRHRLGRDSHGRFKVASVL